MLSNDPIILSLLYKYLYIAITTIIILTGSILVDSYQRVSRILRITGYILVIFMILLDRFVFSFLDSISYPFLLLLGLVGVFVTLYCEGYTRVLLGLARALQLPLDIFMVSLLLLFSSSTLMEFVVFWIITELIGFMLILTEGTRSAWRAAIQYLVVGALTADFSLFTLLAIISYSVGLDKAFMYTFTNIAGLNISAGGILTILLSLGFIAKAALVPLHFWLPDAYTIAPSPASAILSGVMEKMSIYGILRVIEVVNVDVVILEHILIILGVVTTIYASAQALIQRDTKRLLSYSTMAYSGILMSMIGVYVYTGFMQQVLYAVYILMLAHGLSKALLFVNAGSIELLANTREIYELGYLSRIDEEGSKTIVIGTMSLLGIPSTVGFIGKVVAILVLINTIITNYFLALPVLIALIFLSASGIIYGLKYLSTYYGGYKPSPGRILKYSLLNISERIGALLNVIMSIILPFLIISYSTVGVLVVIVNSIGIIGLLVSYAFMRMQHQIRIEEPWLGGARP